ncbi:MAG: hypothetical protein K5841_01990 [Fretibacterium sp.]|nr:hypothetical protein [Fretibacterium sp.]
MRRFNIIVILALAWGLFCGGGAWSSTETLPDKATLSANRMRFDSQTGDFLADGNVTITAGSLTVAAPRGSGNVGRREVLFEEGIVASGDWMGDRVDLEAGKLSLSFAQDPTCRFQGSVKGGVGALRLDADRLTLIGIGGITGEPKTQTKFWVVKARRLEDRSRGLSFGADAVEGILREGELRTLTADRGVWLRGKPKEKGEAVSLKGNHALYSAERGSVVLSGNVSAVQGGRTLKSESIVYFPDQNRVEAMGGAPVPGSREVPASRAEITIDLSREKKRSGNDKVPSSGEAKGSKGAGKGAGKKGSKK